MKLIIFYLAVLITGYFLVHCCLNVSEIAWAKDNAGNIIQPDTTILRCGAIAILLFGHCCVLLLFLREFRQLIIKDRFDEFLNEKQPL